MSLRHAALGLLADGPASGYDLLKTFDRSLAFIWPATQSQLYGELNRLADDGLIEVSHEGPRGRKDYTITEQGRAELERWITDVEPDRIRRNEALLRVFFLGTVGPEHAKAYLEREATVHEDARSTAPKHRARHRLGYQRLQPLRPPRHRKRTPLRTRPSPMGPLGRHSSRQPRNQRNASTNPLDVAAITGDRRLRKGTDFKRTE